jgi:chaperone BCS1
MSTMAKTVIIPAVIGSCLYYSKTFVMHIYSNYISPRMYSSITIDNTEAEYFEAVLEFIETEKNIPINHLLLCKSLHIQSDGHTHLDSMYYRPANTGRVICMVHEGKTIYVKRVKKSSETIRDGDKSTRTGKLLISVIGSDPSAIKSLISDSIQHRNKKTSANICVFMCEDPWMERWNKIAEGKPRTMESVILDKTLSQDVLHDMHNFLVSKEWYNSLGIPYRRGYLFYGPPGNGKTSLCKAFAGELKLDICMLSLCSASVTDSKLINALRIAPIRSLIVLEDVDSVFVQRENSDPASRRLTFSGLLNAIDGIVSQEGRILIMTTNHIEKLDPALIRPGRCDLKLEICNASHDQRAAMFLRFFPGWEASARIYADRIPGDEISMAQIQNHLVDNRDSPEKAIETATQLKAETFD